MRGSCIGMAFVLACPWLVGCAANRSREDAGVEQPSRTDQIEVKEDFYPDGAIRLRREGYLDENGEFVVHGKFTNYWENGQKKSEVIYVHGLRHGPRSSWYQNGQIWILGQNAEGVADRTWTQWYPDGRKALEMHYVNGAFHGTYMEWYPNGQKRREVEYVRGKRQGPETIWGEDGNVARKNEYVDDVLQP